MDLSSRRKRVVKGEKKNSLVSTPLLEIFSDSVGEVRLDMCSK